MEQEHVCGRLNVNNLATEIFKTQTYENVGSSVSGNDLTVGKTEQGSFHKELGKVQE
jgi:hypothetical protein